MTSLIFDEVSSPLLVLPIYSSSVKVVMGYVGVICWMVTRYQKTLVGQGCLNFHVVKLQAIFAK